MIRAILIWAGLMAWAMMACALPMSFSHLTIKDGLSQSTVKAITQDGEGFLWFGTADGLNRYDAYHFTVFRNDPADSLSPGGNDVSSLYYDPVKALLWVGTEDGGISLYDRTTETFTRLRHQDDHPGSLPSDHVRFIGKDPRGTLWVATLGGGLAWWDPQTATFRKPDLTGDPLPNDIYQLAFMAPDQMWAATAEGLFLITPSGNQHMDVQRLKASPALPDGPVMSLLADRRGFLWIGTQQHGLFRHHPATGKTESLTAAYGDLSRTWVRSLLQRRDGSVWAGTSLGLLRFDETGTRFEPLRNDPLDQGSLSDDMVFSLFEDAAGILWTGTYFGGISKADPPEARFVPYTNFHRLFGLNRAANHIRSLYHDGASTLWVTTSKGLLALSEEWFQKPSSPEGAHIWFRDQEQSLILGDALGNLYLNNATGIYIRKKGNPDFTPFRPLLAPGTPPLTWYTHAFSDAGQNLWFLSNGLYRYDPSANLLEMVNPLPDPGISTGRYFITGLEVSDGTFRLASDEGAIFHFNPHTRRLSRLIPAENAPDETAGGAPTRMAADSPPLKTSAPAPEIASTASAGMSVDMREPLPFRTVFSLCEESPGILWVGTSNGLYRFREKEGALTGFTDRDGLANNVVYAVFADRQRNLWCSTNNGISAFNISSGTFTNYSWEDGLQSSEFNQSAAFQSADGTLWFGGIDGFNRIDPSRITLNSFIPPVVLTNLYVYHHRVTPASHPGILHHQINHAGEIILTHRQKIFAFEFAALNFINPGKNRYRYMLKGYDTEWVDARHHQMASYTNINPGEYTFLVQGSNNNGVWNPEPRAVKVTVLPPFWQTWWFRVAALFFLATAAMALLQWRFRSVRLHARLLRKMVDEKTVALQEKNRFIEEQNAELVRINEEISARNEAIGESNARLNEQNEQIIRQRDHLISLSEQLQQAHQARISFFTAISHEFRTPLTLIIAPLRELVTNLGETSPAELRRKFKIIYGSASRLLTLVNQLLDFRKADSGKMELRLSRFELVPFVRQVALLFNDIARRNQISFTFSSVKDPGVVSCDREKVEIILLNLLSNAFKFTPRGGEIAVEVSRSAEEEEHVLITVADSGPGIPEEDMPLIFDTFSQSGGAAARHYPGSGIGLALVKQYAELHGGRVMATARPGGGSLFTVSLPLQPPVERSAALLKDAVPREPGDLTSPPRELPVLQHADLATAGFDDFSPLMLREVKTGDDHHLPRLLLVEDDRDLRAYLREVLSASYRIEEATSGPEGWESALERHPDLVISDVMLPGFTGFELCEKLKGEFQTCHIPVVLLTALSDLPSQMSGIRAGADAYIIKPFDMQHLLLTIDNLISQRRRMQAKYYHGADHNAPDSPLSSEEQEFLARATALVEENITDSSFDVESLCKAIGLSQPQTYRKIKAAAGLSTSEFIRNVRLRNGARLLAAGTKTISEIAYEVGFSDPNYFSKCFTRLYGQTPSEFVKLGKS